MPEAAPNTPAAPAAPPAIITNPAITPEALGIGASDPNHAAFKALGEACGKSLNELQNHVQQTLKGNADQLAENIEKTGKIELALNDALGKFEESSKQILAAQAARDAAEQSKDERFLMDRFHFNVGAMPKGYEKAFPNHPTQLTVEEFRTYQKQLTAWHICCSAAGGDTRERMFADIIGGDQAAENFRKQYAKFTATMWKRTPDAQGGYTLPEPQAHSLTMQARENSVMMREANIVTIGAQATEWVYAGQPTGAETQWVAEGVEPAYTSVMELASKQIKVHKTVTLWKTTTEIVADSLINVMASQNAFTADSLGLALEDAFLTGTGDSNDQPTGLLTADKTGTDDGKIKAADYDHFFKKNTGVTGDLPSNTNADRANWLIDIVNMLRLAYRTNTKWFMSRLTMAAIAKTIDGDNHFVLIPNFANPGQVGTCLGSPIVIAERMPDYNVDNGVALLYGNMKKAYNIVARNDMRNLVNPYKNYATIDVFTSGRWGGGTGDGKSMVFAVSSANA